jgi:alpha-beta hydrolase superfamily lysophospholipase
MRAWLQRAVVWALSGVGTYLAIAGALVIFGTSRPPPPSAAITAPFAAVDTVTLPALRRYRTRDGAELAYREYPGGTANVAVLIHGSAGSSVDLHPLAGLLQTRGYTVYVPDIRGHGANLPHGELAYVGQLDDDMQDLMQSVVRDDPTTHRTLVGFSSGGGFVLRLEAQPRIARYFQQVVLLAPYLRYDAPSVRQESPHDGPPAASTATPWAVASVGRIIGLTMLGRLGVHALDGLPVVVFAVPSDSSRVTRSYSWRMQQNFGADEDYAADIRALPASTTVLVGSADSLLVPGALRREFQSRAPQIAVYCVPHVGHSGLVTAAQGLEAILAVTMAASTAARDAQASASDSSPSPRPRDPPVSASADAAAPPAPSTSTDPCASQ